MLKINLNDARFAEGEVLDHGQCKLKVRCYPRSMRRHKLSPEGVMVMDGGDAKNRFMYCLVSAEGLADANGKPLLLNEETKGLIFDHNLGKVKKDGVMISIADAVLLKDNDLYNQAEGEEGNLSAG